MASVRLLGVYSSELKMWSIQNSVQGHHSDLSCNCQNWKATKTLTSGRKDKLRYIQTREYYPALKGNVLARHKRPYMPVHVPKGKVSAKGHTQFVSNHITFWVSKNIWKQ